MDSGVKSMESIPIEQVSESSSAFNTFDEADLKSGSSTIWKLFTKLNDKNVVCLICSRKLSFSGTSNIWKHLSSRHQKEYLELRGEEKKKNYKRQNIRTFINSKSKVTKSLFF